MKATARLLARGAYRTSDVPVVLQHMLAQGLLSTPSDVPSPTASAAELAAAVEADAARKVAVVLDRDALQGAFADVQDALPQPPFRHCMAAKSSPLASVLDQAWQSGCGVEAASYGEAAAAIARGIAPEWVVFDSPAKTTAELRWALATGVTVNLDGFAELARVEQILAERPSTSKIGIRVNPIHLGQHGSIAIFAVSNPESKFGVPLTPPNVERLLAAFEQHGWLTGLHVHVGSAGTNLNMLTAGAAALYDVASAVEARCGGSAEAPRVQYLDLGGGLPVNFATDQVSPTFAEYGQVLRQKVPALFDDAVNARRVIYTEFGRALLAKTGWVVSQVEYVKEITTDEGVPSLRTAILHAGADLLMRECYAPAAAPDHRITTYDAHGQPLVDRPTGQHSLAGTLCFAGDYTKRGIELPNLAPDDFVVINDAGANSLALWSRHCSRLVPPVFFYHRSPTTGELVVEQANPPEPLGSLLEFWGHGAAPSVSQGVQGGAAQWGM